MKRIILISLISTFIFGLIDAIFLLVAEETIKDKIERVGKFDDVTSELLTGGLAAALALFVATFIRYHLHQKYRILEHPLIDVFGIILGTLSVVYFYRYWKKIKNLNI